MPLALVSVHDKTGLPAFASRLAALGWSFLASGGSAALLRAEGHAVTDVAAYTASPEMLGGRVKTLHPAIHGGILARDRPEDRAELAARGWGFIDLVVVNLYPFEATVARAGVTEAEAIEEIDIGGVALLRAAAKNSSRVTVVCDPADYPALADELASGTAGEATRRRLALKAFGRTSAYDTAISAWLAGQPGQTAAGRAATGQAALVGAGADADVDPGLPGQPERLLRYGENPHQSGAFRTALPGRGPLGGRVLAGKELSYNNILDLDSAWRAVDSVSPAGSEGPACAIVKHLSPCGIALAADLASAFSAALESDPVSAYGGVVALNRPVGAETARLLISLFLECVVAPAFDAEALSILAEKKNLRLVEADPALLAAPSRELRSVTGGWLVQDRDRGDPAAAAWRTVSARGATEAELASLRFAWRASREVRSNAIVLARGRATVGIGGGQTNRVDAVRQAVARAGAKAPGSVMASDAFFPFPDCIEEAAAAGVTAVAHPGGSIRDAEVLAAADRAGMALLVTGTRHFRH